jgi:uncharacterized linocin/CFP29 family protein
MDPALEQLGWTEDQWNRICTTVTEEAQRTRVAAQFLPVVGPEDPTTVAVPAYALTYAPRAAPPPSLQLEVSSDPTLYLTSISVLVELGGREAADPSLSAALTMFRRAANVIARAEDALVFNGRTTGANGAIRRANSLPQIFGINGLPATAGNPPGNIDGLLASNTVTPLPNPFVGGDIATAISTAIGKLDDAGFSGPYACALDQGAFDAICTPTDSLVMPRDRILPFLQGGALVRASTIPRRVVGVRGAVIALSANPVELVVATDINVRYLQTTGHTEPARVFRVSERVALRIKEQDAIAIIT